MLRTQKILIDSTHGGAAVVTVERGEFSCVCFVDGLEVLSRFKGRPWMVSEHIEGVALIADAAKGLYLMTTRAEEGIPQK